MSILLNKIHAGGPHLGGPRTEQVCKNHLGMTETLEVCWVKIRTPKRQVETSVCMCY